MIEKHDEEKEERSTTTCHDSFWKFQGNVYFKGLKIGIQVFDEVLLLPLWLT